MDTPDGSYRKGSPRRQTRSSAAATASMPPPSQLPAAAAASRLISSPNESSMFSPPSFSSTKLSSTQIVCTDRVPDLSAAAGNESVMSYQRVRKVFSQSYSNIDEELRAREEQLAYLKSVDLTKFSSPNESKPRTDYTYANTSSYRATTLTTNHHQEEVMPNLCRRGRRSPAHDYSSSNNSIANFYTTTLSPAKTLLKGASSASLGLLNSSLNSVRSYFSGVVVFSRQSSSTSNRQVGLTDQQLINAKNLNRRLAYELSEQKAKAIEDERRETRGSSALKKFAFLGNLYGLDRDSPPPSVVPSSQQAASVARKPAGNASVGVGASVSDANLPDAARQNSPARTTHINITQTTISEERAAPPPPPRRERRASGCLGGCLLPFVLLLLLLLPIGYKLLQNDEFTSSQFYLAAQGAYREHAEPAWQSARAWTGAGFAWLRDFLLAIPSSLTCMFQLFRCPTPAPSAGLGVEVPASSVELAEEQLNSIKERILSEVKEKFAIQNDAVLEKKVRQELDEKFNATLNLLEDRTSAFESSKKSTMDEIRSMKDDLRQLQSRYSELLRELDQQKTKVTAQEEAARVAKETAEKAQQIVQAQADLISKSASQQAASVAPADQLTGLERNVTFREIEEYIERTFYLYNADKTGKTDFASESVGGSVLFTRCTETYMEGARWFTVFDVPITRITVSPRVVIQGTMQPGNCWAFKGSKADLFIKLAARIRPTSFSIEHIPKELSITGNIDSAPQNFTIYGYTNKEEISDDKRLLLGSYRYDNNSKSPLQFFDATHHYNVPIGVIELKIESNAGNKDYTCLYKFRVHGELFKPPASTGPLDQTSGGDSNSIAHENQPAKTLLNEN